MSTWSLEHIPAAGGASTFGSLQVWGIESFAWQRVNWGIDTLSVTVCGSAPAFSSAVWSYLDKIVLWRDGVRFAQVWCTFSQANVQPHQTRTYTLLGPGWWLTQYIADYNPLVAPYYIGTYISDAVLRAIQYGAPLAIDTGLAAALMVHCPDVRTSASALELIQRACRYAPLSAGWWDYSAETPILHAARRAALTALDLVRSDYVEVFSLAPRYDLQLISVRIEYSWTDADGSTRYLYNLAGSDADRMGPNRLHVPIGCSDQASALKAGSAGIAEVLLTDLGTLCWTGSIALHDGAHRIPDIRPGTAVNLIGTGCPAEWATMGAVVQQVTYQHRLGTDTATIELGAPEHLGPQDYLETSTLASEAASSAAGNPSPYESSTPAIPGTLDDLNGTTGAGTPTGTIAVQSRGGVWTHRGFFEETDDNLPPSIPPVLYLHKTWSGAVRALYYKESPPAVCATQQSTSTRAYAGSRSIDPATGTESGDGAIITRTSCTGDVQVLSGQAGDRLTGDAQRVEVMSHTRLRVHRADNDCQGTSEYSYMCGGSYRGDPTAYAYRDLSDPDLPSAAQARMLSTAEWSADPTTAISTVPTTGITGIYRRLRYRTEHTVSEATVYPTLTGLAIWARYRLRIVLQRRAVDSAGLPAGDYATAKTVYSDPFTSDINGEGGMDWAEIEPEDGYETAIQSATLELY